MKIQIKGIGISKGRHFDSWNHGQHSCVPAGVLERHSLQRDGKKNFVVVSSRGSRIKAADLPNKRAPTFGEGEPARLHVRDVELLDAVLLHHGDGETWRTRREKDAGVGVTVMGHE